MSTPAPRQLYAALSADAKSADGWCLIAPAGRFRAGDGRPEKPAAGWIVAEPAALVDRLNARQAQMCVDYEHASLSAAKTGVAAPAAGWVTGWRWDDAAGLSAQISWCARAQSMIDADEYRYLSPVLIYDEPSGAVLSIYNIALTNNPALDQLPAVQAALAALSQHQQTGGSAVDEFQAEMLRRLKYMFDLPEGSTPQDILAHLQKVLDYLGGGRAAGAAPLSLMTALESRDQQIVALTAALDAAKSAPASAPLAGMVPVAVVQSMQAQIAALTAQQATDALRGKISAALADGRLLPAMQGWAEAQLAGTADQRAALSSYIDSAVPMPALAGSQTAALAAAGGAGAGGGQVAALTAVELEICARTGIEPDAFAVQKNGGKQ